MFKPFKKSLSSGVKFRHKTEKEQEQSIKHARRQASKSEKYPQPNHTFAKENEQFRNACELCEELYGVKVEPNARQASKFRNQRGLAYRALKEVG